MIFQIHYLFEIVEFPMPYDLFSVRFLFLESE
jgi:hypothetical protein